MAKKSDDNVEIKRLTPKQELFCQYYVGIRGNYYLGNQTQSYIEAFGIKNIYTRNIPKAVRKTGKKKWWSYGAIRNKACMLMTKGNILARVNKLSAQYNSPEVAENELGFMIRQHEDYRAKVAALRLFFEKGGKIKTKIDLTTGGKPLTGKAVPLDIKNIDKYDEKKLRALVTEQIKAQREVQSRRQGAKRR